MSKNQKRFLRGGGPQCMCVIVLGAAVAAGSAAAQDGGALQEVVVTVRRTAERLQDVPAAISALSNEQMEARQVNTAESLASAIPNLQVSGAYGRVQPIFSIRGVSMSDYSSNQASPIGVYADEAYLGATYIHGLAFFDLERVEVARGPQGTLYGRNTTGGAINLISRTTKIGDAADGYLRLGYGDHNTRTADAAIGGTVIPDRLALRGAFTLNADDGYFKNTLGGPNLAQTKYLAGRATAQLRVTDDLTATLKYAAGDSDPRIDAPYAQGRVPVPGLGLADFSGYVTPPDREAWTGAENIVGKVKVRLNLATLRLDWIVADRLSLVSVSSWYDAHYNQPQRNADGSPRRLLEIDWKSDAKAYSQDLRLAYEDGGLRAVAGVYYGYEQIGLRNQYHLYEDPLLVVRFADPTFAALLEQYGTIDERLNTTKTSWAGYGQVTWPIAERLNLEAGLRYTIDKSRLDDLNISRLAQDGTPIGSWVPGNNSGIDAPLLPPSFAPPNGLYLSGPYTTASIPSVSVTDQDPTGRLSVDYELTNLAKVYVSYSRGYRSGSFNGGVFYAPRPVKDLYAAPEHINAYEAGLKSDLFARRVRLNLAAFQYDYTDQQFINVVGVSTFLVNAGASRNRGLEAELTWQATDALRLEATASVLDAKFTKLRLADTTSSVIGAQIDLSGHQLISAPKFSTTLNADYERPIGEHMVRINVNGNYRTHQWYSAYNDSIGYGAIGQSGYWLTNGRISYSWAADRYAISLWGRNLLDKHYNIYALNLQSGFGYDLFQEGEPRRYGVELSARF